MMHTENNTLQRIWKHSDKAPIHTFKFVQLTLEQDFPRELSCLLPSQLEYFHYQKEKLSPTLGDEIPNVNDTATQKSFKQE